ncbi:MAG: DUF2017 family protein [Acidimicrobiales bacterium]
MFELVKTHRDGTYSILFPDHLVELVVGLAGQLDSMLDDDRPELTRLFPTAYADDAERDAGYQILARGELIDQRRAHVERVAETAGADRVDEETVLAWMHVINDLRLVLGTMLDVSEDEPDVDDDDPRADGLEIYHILGVLLESIVGALHSRLTD